MSLGVLTFLKICYMSPPVGQCETAYNSKLFDQERYYELSVIGTEVSPTPMQLL